MKITLIKQQDNTFKADGSDYEAIKKLKIGQEYQCEITRPRNYKMLRKFFALINLVYENQERYVNREHLRQDLIIEAGHYSIRHNLAGDPIYEAKSIKFSSMTQDNFEDLYDRVLDVIQKHFNFSKESVINELNKF